MAKIGDTVRFLNDVGGGVIVRMEGRVAYVRDPHDGFEIPMSVSELIVVPGAGAAEHYTDPEPVAVAAEEERPMLKSKPANHPYLTAALLFEPQDIRRLSQTAFDLYLVNDSNFRIYFAVASRDDDSSQWRLIDSGEAEPNVQVFIGEVAQCDLNSLRRLSVQIIACKTDEPFNLMPPVGFETRLDLTRLAKLHCFTSTAYSTTPVLTVPVITNGHPVDEPDLTPLRRGSEDMAKAEALALHKKPVQPKPSKGEPEVVDLHIHELLDTTAGLQPADMLACQLREFDRRMEAAAKHPGAKIIFIHGKGEGVLRAALLDRLRKRWPRCEVQDASFREYGFGATQVTIRR